MIHFGSDLDESMLGASLAFVVDAIVTVAGDAADQPKPVEELQGLVYGMANADETRRARHTLVGVAGAARVVTLAGAAILTIVFW